MTVAAPSVLLAHLMGETWHIANLLHDGGASLGLILGIGLFLWGRAERLRDQGATNTRALAGEEDRGQLVLHSTKAEGSVMSFGCLANLHCCGPVSLGDFLVTKWHKIPFLDPGHAEAEAGHLSCLAAGPIRQYLMAIRPTDLATTWLTPVGNSGD